MKKCVVLGIIFMLAFGATGCGNKESAAPNQEKSAEVEQGQSTEPEQGETVEVEQSVGVVLNSVTTTDEDEWDELEEGKELLVLDISVTNHLESDYDFNPYYLTVQANGDAISESGIAPKGQNLLSVYKMAPEETLTGIVSFEVDEGTTDYRIFYTDFDDTDIELKE